MSQLLRWQYVVPRLLLVIVALLAVQYVLGIAARNAAIRWSETVVGAPLKLANARVSFSDRQVVFSGVHLANPLQPSENLIEADCCAFQFAAAPFLHQQALVERGRISGLRVNSLGLPATRDWSDDKSGELAREWFTGLANRFKLKLVDQFESIERSEALCDEWQQRLAAIDSRAAELNSNADELQQQASTAETNRLRHDQFFSGLPQEIAALRKEYAQLADDVAKLPQALEDQRRAIIAAGKKDQQLLRRRLRLEPIDPATLSDYLLQEQVADPLNDVVALLSWMRQAVPATASEPHRPTRGQDILFAGVRPTPNFLIRALELQGSATLGGQPVELHGMLTGISSEPRLHTDPIQLRLAATGAVPMDLQATIDRTDAVARDEIVIECRGLTLPQLCLGDSDQLQMKLTSSTATLSVNARVEDGKLAGDIELVQNQVCVAPQLNGELSVVPLAGPLKKTLAKVDSISTRLTLGGTLEDPSYKLSSNLGLLVAEALEKALRRTGDEHARAILADARRQIDERLAGLERQIADYQKNFAAQSTHFQRGLENIASQQLRRERLSVEQLGRTLPDTSLFR